MKDNLKTYLMRVARKLTSLITNFIMQYKSQEEQSQF
jgi:hypothetical protein